MANTKKKKENSYNVHFSSAPAILLWAFHSFCIFRAAIIASALSDASAANWPSPTAPNIILQTQV